MSGGAGVGQPRQSCGSSRRASPAGVKPRRQRGATGISSSLLFAWRKAYRAGTLVDAGPGSFVPAVVVEEHSAPAPCRIEILTPSGYRVWVDADVDEAALLRVLAALARA